MDKNALAKTLRILAAEVERWSPVQVEDLLTGRAKLGLVEPRRSKHEERATYSLDGILQQLNVASDRTGAREILAAIPSRQALARLARDMNIHVVKSDRREAIESKIVEFVTGGKLRSEAIRSLDLKNR